MADDAQPVGDRAAALIKELQTHFNKKSEEEVILEGLIILKIIKNAQLRGGAIGIYDGEAFQQILMGNETEKPQIIVPKDASENLKDKG